MIYGQSDSEDPVVDEDQYEELTAIKGFEGGDGERLLRFLNEQTAKQQLENGIGESDVFLGTTILNSTGKTLV